MPSLALLARCCGALMLVFLATACEGPNWQRDNAGGSIRVDDRTPIDPSQLTANLAEVLAGLPLKDAKRALRDNAVQHDNVIITDRGFANAQRVIAPYSYFGEHVFSQLRSRDSFDAWVRGRLPQAKLVEFADVIPVIHPTTATRGYVATVMVTDQQDRKFRCAMAYAGYGGPRLSASSTDIFRMEELKSTLQIMLCTTNASAAWLHQRMQRVMF
jgi:hypothetical protein